MSTNENEHETVGLDVSIGEAATALTTVFVQSAVSTAAGAARCGRHDEAASALLPIVRATMPAVSALDLLARIEAQRGRISRAAFLWERVLEVDPENDAASAGLRRIGKLKSRPNDIHDLLTRGVAVVTTTRGGEILGWNDAATALFGSTAEEMYGRSVSDLFPVKFARLDRLNASDALRGSSVEDVRMHCVRRNKSRFRASCSVRPIRSGIDAIAGVRRTIRAVR